MGVDWADFEQAFFSQFGFEVITIESKSLMIHGVATRRFRVTLERDDSGVFVRGPWGPTLEGAVQSALRMELAAYNQEV